MHHCQSETLNSVGTPDEVNQVGNLPGLSELHSRLDQTNIVNVRRDLRIVASSSRQSNKTAVCKYIELCGQTHFMPNGPFPTQTHKHNSPIYRCINSARALTIIVMRVNCTFS